MVPRMVKSVTTIERVMVMIKTVTIRMIAISHHRMTVRTKIGGHIDTYFHIFLLHFRHMYDGLEMSISYQKMGNSLANKNNGTVRREFGI